MTRHQQHEYKKKTHKNQLLSWLLEIYVKAESVWEYKTLTMILSLTDLPSCVQDVQQGRLSINDGLTLVCIL